MRPDVGAIEKDHAKRDGVLLDEIEQALPHAPRMKSCAASHHGPNSVGILRHFAPFWCRQKIAEIVRRNSFGGVLPRGRTCSINGSQTAHAASVKISYPL